MGGRRRARVVVRCACVALGAWCVKFVVADERFIMSRCRAAPIADKEGGGERSEVARETWAVAAARLPAPSLSQRATVTPPSPARLLPTPNQVSDT